VSVFVRRLKIPENEYYIYSNYMYLVFTFKCFNINVLLYPLYWILIVYVYIYEILEDSMP